MYFLLCFIYLTDLLTGCFIADQDFKICCDFCDFFVICDIYYIEEIFPVP